MRGWQVELVTPPEGATPGDRVTVEGFSGEPEEQLNPKKKQFEQISPDLATNNERVACYRGVSAADSDGRVHGAQHHGRRHKMSS